MHRRSDFDDLYLIIALVNVLFTVRSVTSPAPLIFLIYVLFSENFIIFETTINLDYFVFITCFCHPFIKKIHV